MNQEKDGEHAPRHGSRRSERLRVEVKIDLRSGQSRLTAFVTDISATGLRLRTLSPLRLGDAFWVKLPAIEARHLTVKWTDGFISGCEFDEPLAQYVLEHVTKNLPNFDPTIIDRRDGPRD